MNFSELKSTIIRYSSDYDFIEASDLLQKELLAIDRDSLLSFIVEIGAIPEEIGHDSTEEKLYAKVSDILFARALQEMGLTTQVLTKRGNCADIVAQSSHFNYSLVGDAKAFRLSRTAKNAKDFKVSSMNSWRGDCDYAVLACPYYQYPNNKSQIYKEALSLNVTLFSWEQLYILLQEGVREAPGFSLEGLWKQSLEISQETKMGEAEKNFLSNQHQRISDFIGLNEEDSLAYFATIKEMLRERGYDEIRYYDNEIARIRTLEREEAIEELLLSMKLNNKINSIRRFIEQVCQE